MRNRGQTAIIIRASGIYDACRNDFGSLLGMEGSSARVNSRCPNKTSKGFAITLVPDAMLPHHQGTSDRKVSRLTVSVRLYSFSCWLGIESFLVMNEFKSRVCSKPCFLDPYMLLLSGSGFDLGSAWVVEGHYTCILNFGVHGILHMILRPAFVGGSPCSQAP